MENNSSMENNSEGNGLNFSRSQDKVLVDHVAQHPALWQLTHDFYRDTEMKHNIWKEISNYVGKPVDACKKRWKNIKDTYDRKIKLSGGRNLTRKGAKWELHEKLQFLQPSIERNQRCIKREKKERNVNNIYVEEVELNDILSTQHSYVGEPETILEESCGSPSSLHSVSYSEKLTSCSSKTYEEAQFHPNLKEERPEHAQIIHKSTTSDGRSGIDLFFQSLAETVKSFPPRLQQRAKIEALSVISALELELWNSIDC